MKRAAAHGLQDSFGERRRKWIAAGAPGITVRYARLYDRDQRGRPTFAYTPAHATDVGKTFARVRRQLGLR